MNKITELLMDRKYAAELLNGPCRPKNGNRGCAPINLDWIDETMSEAVTEEENVEKSASHVTLKRD